MDDITGEMCISKKRYTRYFCYKILVKETLNYYIGVHENIESIVQKIIVQLRRALKLETNL
jgi:hypothetical protein